MFKERSLLKGSPVICTAWPVNSAWRKMCIRDRVYSARYYVNNVIPQVWLTADIVKEGDDSALQIPLGAFDY